MARGLVYLGLLLMAVGIPLTLCGSLYALVNAPQVVSVPFCAENETFIDERVTLMRDDGRAYCEDAVGVRRDVTEVFAEWRDLRAAPMTPGIIGVAAGVGMAGFGFILGVVGLVASKPKTVDADAQRRRENQPRSPEHRRP
jgi:hypothetical protein